MKENFFRENLKSKMDSKEIMTIYSQLQLFYIVRIVLFRTYNDIANSAAFFYDS